MGLKYVHLDSMPFYLQQHFPVDHLVLVGVQLRRREANQVNLALTERDTGPIPYIQRLLNLQNNDVES